MKKSNKPESRKINTNFRDEYGNFNTGKVGMLIALFFSFILLVMFTVFDYYMLKKSYEIYESLKKPTLKDVEAVTSILKMIGILTGSILIQIIIFVASYRIKKRPQVTNIVVREDDNNK